jgi:Peptidase family M28/PA domain
MSRSWFTRAGAVTVVAVLATSGVASADPSNNNSEKLRAAVSAAGILEHQSAFSGISGSSGGNRLAGAPGYDASASYVAQRSAAAGMNVSSHNFSYFLDFLADFTPPRLAVTAGGPARAFVPGIAGGSLGGDFGSMYNSRSTDITAPVFAVDLNLDPAAPVNSNTSGCQSSDYNGMPSGAIALVQRGTCTFAQKFKLADRSGAGGMILFNEGQPGRTIPLWFDVTGIDVPSMAATYDAAEALANGVEHGLTGLTARFKIDWRPGTYPTRNVIAETASGDPNNVIVVGAHLDSVGVGAGINDNGSGSAGILEIAEQLSGVTLRNKIRFVWFSAEESGLLGSEAYVASLPAGERDKIAAMLNFDMIGSPNFVRFVYDGDLSDSEPPAGGAPAGSAEIEDLFLDYFASQGLATRPTAFDGRSDYGPFIEAGIPAGGLFTGAEGIKTAEEAAVFGGTAGQQYDPCYHLGCDGLSNLSTLALEQMADAAAHATITLAQANQRAGGPRARAKYDVRAFPRPKPQKTGGL